MRHCLLALPLAIVAFPAAAAQAQQPEPVQVPPQLTDPAMADRLADMMQAMSKAFLQLPVGEIEAAAQGRRASPHEKALTMGDVGRRDDPEFDRKFAEGMANARPIIRQSLSAFARTLPAITESLSEAAIELERATANMPRPVSPLP